MIVAIHQSLNSNKLHIQDNTELSNRNGSFEKCFKGGGGGGGGSHLACFTISQSIITLFFRWLHALAPCFFKDFFASNCFYKKVKVDFVILPIVSIVLRKRSVMNACQTISNDARRGKMSYLGHCSKKLYSKT